MSLRATDIVGIAADTEKLWEQYVHRVLFTSDQFGPSTSISYTALNITGPPSNFPDCGEFVDSFMLTTHGNWWRDELAFNPEFGLNNVPDAQNPRVHDFVVVSFEKSVYPVMLQIYETYNPRAISRIWACNYPVRPIKWVLLWQRSYGVGRPQSRSEMPGVFRPNIVQSTAPMCVLRLEFDTTNSFYLPGFDGILLKGLVRGPEKRQAMIYRTPIAQVGENEALGFAGSNITDLPVEILLNIFSFLDIPSLSSVERVCHKFKMISNDPCLYREVNLRPYWMKVDSNKMQWLEARCNRIRKLDVSWCGMFDVNFAASVHKFLTMCGKFITHLRIDDVPVDFTQEQLCEIADRCPRLEEVSLKQIQLQSLPEYLSFFNLTRLNISRTELGTECLMNLLPRSPQLQHLNLTCCQCINLNEIVQTIAKHNRELISLNMWKAGALIPSVLRALQSCTKLRQLDIGWTIQRESLNGALGDVLKSCPGMVMLGLSGMRILQDSDVEDIAKYCPQLEQLDLMGCISITGTSMDRVFIKCPKLRYVDLNHCEAIDSDFLVHWDHTLGDNVVIMFEEKLILYHIEHVQSDPGMV